MGRRGDKQRNTTQSAEFPHAVKKVHESYKHNLSRRKKIQSTVEWKMLLFFVTSFHNGYNNNPYIYHDDHQKKNTDSSGPPQWMDEG